MYLYVTNICIINNVDTQFSKQITKSKAKMLQMKTGSNFSSYISRHTYLLHCTLKDEYNYKISSYCGKSQTLSRINHYLFC